MKETLERLEHIVLKAEKTILGISKDALNHKISEDKWSKKEILGHLIDSAMHNLQRFTEVQFEPKPYRIRKYNQNKLVKVNCYQKSEIEVLLQLWISLNTQIIFVLKNSTLDMLSYVIELDQDNVKTLEWLIFDYIEHMQHHLKQIKN
ncbi:DinB family protein [Aquimarina sp. 2304DJ70-9]|uniref:DinB family protein n=1 Tax=Aquimarina penaris TaxID=3231044 RepID=UPI003462FEAE